MNNGIVFKLIMHVKFFICISYIIAQYGTYRYILMIKHMLII